MDVATWLQGLGLDRHEATFRDNLIDMESFASWAKTTSKSSVWRWATASAS